jgi:hypothetical protein
MDSGAWTLEQIIYYLIKVPVVKSMWSLVNTWLVKWLKWTESESRKVLHFDNLHLY